MDGWKPSTALGAVSLALFVTAVVALTGTAHEMTWYGYLFGTVAFGSLSLMHLLALALRGLFGIWERVLQMAELHQKLKPPADTPPPAAEPVIEKENDYDPEQEAWRVALDRFFRAGDAAGGFSAGKLSGVAGSDSWPRLVHFYASEVGGNVLRDAGGNIGHTWGHGWTLDRVMLALGNNRLPRPEMPLPVIAPFVVSATQRNTARKSKTVINGTVKAAE